MAEETSSTPPKSFAFSTAGLPDVLRDARQRIEAYEYRLREIVREFTLTVPDSPGHDFPVIDQILRITHDRTELENLGLALQKVAEIVEELDEWKDREQLLETMERVPDWFEAAFTEVPDIPDPTDFL